MSKQICLYLHVHQPFRLNRLNYLDIGETTDYFVGSPHSNKFFMDKVAKKSYLPTNKMLLKLLKAHKDFKISLSISGVVLEQMHMYNPKVLETFQELVATGRVEVVAETYYHSLAGMYSISEFCEQIFQQYNTIKKTFGVEPTAFRNTELIYNNYIATIAKELGFKAILAEGWEPVLGWKSPNYMYEADTVVLSKDDYATVKKFKINSRAKQLKLLLRNYKLSDDIAFRFSNKNWEDYPLTHDKFFRWVSTSSGDLINLFIDYETFGEHQWEDSGIFKFLEKLPAEAEAKKVGFTTVSQAAEREAKDTVSIEDTISWADLERDTSAWDGNKMQKAAIAKVYELETQIKEATEKLRSKSAQTKLLHDWRRLQTSDHFYYMSTKYWSDGDVHKYFSPYDSPYEAFINYMNILEDFVQRLDHELKLLTNTGTAHAKKTRLRSSN